MSRLSRIAAWGTVALVLAIPTAALPHGKAKGIVKERMDDMIAMRDAAKVIGGMVKGATPYDANEVRRHAATIRNHAGETLTVKFPVGTGGMPSEARDSIWAEFEDFSALAKRLEMLAGALEEAADNGLMKDMNGQAMDHGKMSHGAMDDPAMLAAMPADAVFMMVGQACSACHEKYREKMD